MSPAPGVRGQRHDQRSAYTSAARSGKPCSAADPRASAVSAQPAGGTEEQRRGDGVRHRAQENGPLRPVRDRGAVQQRLLRSRCTVFGQNVQQGESARSLKGSEIPGNVSLTEESFLSMKLAITRDAAILIPVSIIPE